jgi:hypothetical protein
LPKHSGQPPREVAKDIEVKTFILKHPDAIGDIERKWVDDCVKVVPPK